MSYLSFLMGAVVMILVITAIWMYRGFTRNYNRGIDRINRIYETERFRKNMIEIGAEDEVDKALSSLTSIRKIRKENNKIEKKLKMSRWESDKRLEKWKVKQLNKKNHDKETV